MTAIIYVIFTAFGDQRFGLLSIRSSIFEEVENLTCQAMQRTGLGAQRKDFEIRVKVVRSNCFQSERDSHDLSARLNFLHRGRWAPLYRKGCWAPDFSRIDKINRTLIIDCLPSMQPRYGFEKRLNVNQNYTGPVRLDGHEWIYAKCDLPYHAEPTVRLHFHPRPLPDPTNKAKKRPNIVFLQFDALGRFGMHRRMPESYALLQSYSRNKNLSFSTIEFSHLNVNGRNSEPNMRRLYCGSSSCQTTSLLRLYKQMGYATSLLDSYNYEMHKFIPYRSVDSVLAYKYFSEFGSDTVQLYNQRSGCIMGTTWISDQILDYVQERLMMMRQGGWFSVNVILDAHTEDELNNYAVLDTRFYHFLRALRESEALENTILILVADHGLHGHDWQDLWRVYEQRNPLLQILIGKKVEGWEQMVENLRVNSDKLVTHGDLYMTFAKYSGASLPLKLDKTVDLLSEGVSSTRTCRSAGLPDEWCNCWVPKNCNITDT